MENGTVSLTRYAGKTMRATKLVTDQSVPAVGSNSHTVGFDIMTPDGAQLHVRLDHTLVERLYEIMQHARTVL